MTATPLVSIIIPVHNEKHFLIQTLDALKASVEESMEIIVVDDGSTDGGCDPLRHGSQQWHNVRVITQERCGVAFARNVGASASLAQTLVFLDGHCFPKSGWLPGLMDELDRRPNCIVAPCVATATNPVARGYGLTLTDRCFNYRWLARESLSPYDIPIAGGGCMAIRKTYFEALGQFDSMRFYGKEDVEICLRCWLSGGSVVVVPSSEVVHVFKKTFHYTISLEDVTYNALRTAVLHFEGPHLARIIKFLEARHVYPNAVRKLIMSDIWDRRAFVNGRRTRSGEWFCERFSVDL